MCSHMTNKKRDISNFTNPNVTKVDRVVANGIGSSVKKLHQLLIR